MTADMWTCPRCGMALRRAHAGYHDRVVCIRAIMYTRAHGQVPVIACACHAQPCAKHPPAPPTDTK